MSDRKSRPKQTHSPNSLPAGAFSKSAPDALVQSSANDDFRVSTKAGKSAKNMGGTEPQEASTEEDITSFERAGAKSGKKMVG